MNPSTLAATVLVDELVRLGMREAVLCPGSRSAPLAYALHAADRAGRLRLHVRVDERSAAFLALGLGKLTGAPAVVVTTSGTAVANLHPAVLEAHEADVPLLVVTADRPPELRGTRANQTTHQVGFFGDAVRWAHDLPTPDDGSATAAAWRTAADRAVAAALGALGGDRGPVHLNAPLRDPLAPDVDDLAPGAAPLDGPEGVTGRPGGAPWTAVPPTAGPGHDPVGGLGDVPRTLVVLGDAPLEVHSAALAAAARWGHPVLAEPFGWARPGVEAAPAGPRLPHGALLAPLARRPELRPDRVLVVGRPTLSRAVAALLRLPGVAVDLVADGTRWPDPGHVVRAVHPCSVLDGPGAHAPSAEAVAYADAWAAAAHRAGAAVRPLLADSWPAGPALATTLLAALPDDALLFLGSSNGVRDVDAARSGDATQVVASRGLAGIDGAISTASGLALAARERPTYALLGDLTFLHDTNGLLIGPGEPRPDLTIVVANDDGGGIFATLEYGEPGRRAADSGALGRVFATPTGVRLADLCRAHGVPHDVAASPQQLAAAVGAVPSGVRVVEVTLPAADRRNLDARLRAAVQDSADGGGRTSAA